MTEVRFGVVKEVYRTGDVIYSRGLGALRELVERRSAIQNPRDSMGVDCIGWKNEKQEAGC